MIKNPKRLGLISLLALSMLGASYTVYGAFNFQSEQPGIVTGATATYYLRHLIRTGEPTDPYSNWQATTRECRNGSCSNTPWRDLVGNEMTSANCENAAAQAGFSETAAITCTETTRGIWEWEGSWDGYCAEYTCGAGPLYGLEYTVAVYPGHLSPSQVCPVEEFVPAASAWIHPGQLPEAHLPNCTTSWHGNAVPTATLTANPTTVATGGTSALTHSCTNSTSASISSVGAVSATTGTTSVTPATTTTYTLTCTGSSGSATASATVTVTPSPALAGSCSVSPSTIAAGGSATWSASASGGTGAYTYAWSGTDGLAGTGPSVTKAYTTVGTHTGSVTITSGAESITQACGNSLTVTVTEVTAADLTAGSVSPTSATAGQGVTLSATATNIGNAISGSFPMLFQVQSPASLENSSYLSGLASGASGSGSVSHTFASAGTYQVRACANFNTGWTAIVTESNYGNNCGPWTTITVAGEEVPPDGTLSCSVSNSNPAIGEEVTYSALGATTPYTWNPSDGVGSYGTGSTASRTFASEGSFGMSVSKGGFTSGNCPVVTVGAVSCGTADATITANPTRVRQGETTSLTWSASGVDASCTISGPGVSQTVSGNACTVPNGSATPTINTQSVYRITCDDGEATDEVVVNVIPRFEEF